ncbi:MAG TPA: ComEC/Rec2 family competence protein [Candidatus Saccharimonadales bacterium]|nr:ComEC/Rec2 family competence protein [Candidatus Saccharimonadales bacterium]
MIAVCIAGLLLGVWRGGAVHGQLVTFTNYVGQKVVITGTVANDPSYGAKGQRDFTLNTITLDGRSPPGEVRITTFSMIHARRGDRVRAVGKLYNGFGNYQAAVYFAEAKVIAVAHNPLEELRRMFAASLYTNLPVTEASLGIGILVGIKTGLPDDLDAQLKVLSLTHIVVASGYNLTILVRAARRLFEKRSKYQTALTAAVLMAGFVGVTGFSPSMSRAALVSGLSVLAWYYGRRIHPMVLLLFAAAITAGLDPLDFWYDIGWWLSFLAFAGVLIVAPLLQHRLFGKKEPKLIGQIMLETIAAQVMTLPLLLAIFGAPSLLALPANILIVPLVPLIMLLAFSGGLAGLVMPAVAAYVSLPAGWLLAYVVQLVGLLAQIPWAIVQVTIPPQSMIACYGGIVLICIVLWRTTGHNFLTKSMVE